MKRASLAVAEVVADEVVVDTKAEKINDLHDKFCSQCRVSIETAIMIGGLLTEQKASLEYGKWGAWIEDRLSFGKKTVCNYMRCFQDKDRLVSVTNLTEAYRLIEAPGKGKQAEKKKPKGETREPEPKTHTEAPPDEQEQTDGEQADGEDFTESGDDPVRASSDIAERETPKEALLDTLHEIKDNVDSMIYDIHLFERAYGNVDRTIFKQFTAEEKEDVRELVRDYDKLREIMSIIRKSVGRRWLNKQ